MHDVTFFTCSTCPWAHRVALVLQELNLAHRVESIDLDKPRDPEYLKVNPRGTVPSLRVDGVVLTESSIIVHFLTDSHPSHLLPASDVEGGPMRRARIAFFVETYMTKFNGPCTEAVIGSAAGQPADTGFEERLRKTVVAELEPLLSDAAPYFGGSERITLAELLVGPFAVRMLSLAKIGVFSSWGTTLPDTAPAFWRWVGAVQEHPSFRQTYDEDANVKAMQDKFFSGKRGAE